MLSPATAYNSCTSRKLATVGDDHWLRAGTTLGANTLNLPHDIIALNHLSENDVLVIQPRGDHCGDEELHTINSVTHAHAS